jgi:subtilisin family serine protease
LKISTIILCILAVSIIASSSTSSTPLAHAAIVIRGIPNRKGEVSIFVEGDNILSHDEVQMLSTYGTVSTVAGPVAVLHTLVASLPSIARLPFVTRIEDSHSLSVDLESGVPDTGAREVWQQVRDPDGNQVTGAGVILGFVDTGIDTSHPDFSFPNGTTKILYVWDQTTRGQPPAGFDYGYECTSNDIQDKRCPETDTYGHGTHVAGIATSSGMATGNYTGVAPGASIIFVKSGFSVCNGASWSFDTTQILDGINYIMEKAAKLRERAVISLSLGGNIGAHDGTDPFELGLDAFVEAGIPVVVAAGNQARDKSHIRGELSQGSSVTFGLQVQQSTVDLQIDVWYSPQDQIDATLTGPNGEKYDVPTIPGGTISTFGNITALTSSSHTGNEVYLEVNSTYNLPTNGWSVTLQGHQIHSQGSWDAWTDAITCSYPGSFFTPGSGYEIDEHDTVGIPGTAKDVVTVGAYISNTTWTGMNGQVYGRPEMTPGGIASFSSWGPTRDGRIKPDVVAPGTIITSARSSAVPEQDNDPDAFHRILAGTSMATPHVAGVIALMLQYEPHLQAMAIPSMIRQTARLDANTGLITAGSPIWGFGKIDARTATGFFRFTLVTQGIPSTITVPVRIDDGHTLEPQGGSWVTLYFLKGRTHSISLVHQIQVEPGTRYELGNDSFVVSDNSLVSYTVEYLLDVNSQFGPTSGGGWYNVNSTVKVSAPDRVPVGGSLDFLGVAYVLAYWIGPDGRAVSSQVVMNSPRNVTAVYVLRFPIETFVVGLVVVAAVLVLLVIVARKRTS